MSCTHVQHANNFDGWGSGEPECSEFFRNLLSNVFSQTLGQSAPPTDTKLSAASEMRKNSFFTSFMVCVYSNS